MIALSKEMLFHMYVVQEMSDEEISKYTGTSSLTISYFRRIHGIKRTNKKNLHFSHELVASQLRVFGHEVQIIEDKSDDKSFDLLVNNKTRVEVIYSTAIEHNAHEEALYRFLLYSTKRYVDPTSQLYIPISKGHFRKLFRETCDILVFVGHHKEKNVYHFWVMPSFILRDNQRSLGLYIDANTNNKYSKYEDAWDLFESENNV
ncbi:hypothetical protein CN918_25395 [Priestia megaterium]|nr:hypothetical protein CN918_25395 [Priestia megaterium]